MPQFHLAINCNLNAATDQHDAVRPAKHVTSRSTFVCIRTRGTAHSLAQIQICGGWLVGRVSYFGLRSERSCGREAFESDLFGKTKHQGRLIIGLHRGAIHEFRHNGVLIRTHLLRHSDKSVVWSKILASCRGLATPGGTQGLMKPRHCCPLLVLLTIWV